MQQSKNMIAFYVNDISASVNFYQRLLDTQPLEQSDAFAMFVLPSGLLLGLWLTSTVSPKVTTCGTEGELIFSLSTGEKVDRQYQTLMEKKLINGTAPTMLEFGYTFIITDPDNHRIRYFHDGEMIG
jgi:predicted lactoylglutathione lyase